MLYFDVAACWVVRLEDFEPTLLFAADILFDETEAFRPTAFFAEDFREVVFRTDADEIGISRITDDDFDLALLEGLMNSAVSGLTVSMKSAATSRPVSAICESWSITPLMMLLSSLLLFAIIFSLFPLSS